MGGNLQQNLSDGILAGEEEGARGERVLGRVGAGWRVQRVLTPPDPPVLRKGSEPGIFLLVIPLRGSPPRGQGWRQVDQLDSCGNCPGYSWRLQTRAVVLRMEMSSCKGCSE